LQKIINNPKLVVNEMLSGFVKCHPGVVVSPEDPRVFSLRSPGRTPRVGVVSGGGSGHYPAFIGYVRPYMLDAVAVGEIFRAPPAETFLHAFRAADRGKGVICLHGNYALDNSSVCRAIELARQEGIEVRRVIANDDVAPHKDANSRGLAGEVFLWKIGGAAAARGMSLDEVETVCRRAMASMRSIGVGLSACTIPEVGVPNFDVVEGTMEVGIGHHGDPGITTYKLRPAAEIADLLMAEILRDADFRAGDDVSVLVSGLGATTQMELFILFDRISEILKGERLKIYRSYVGNYFTSLDMRGATVTVMRMDQELRELLRYHENVCL